MGSPVALLVATMDTKGQEALFLESCLKEVGVSVRILDAGIRGKSPARTSISREDIALAGGKTLAEVQGISHEGEALAIMTSGAIQCAQHLFDQSKIQGIIGLGGSMGTTLGTAVMRAFPVGFPKVMISTMASRDTRAFVGTKDILMLHAVCDLAGLNRITRKILGNGALALAGMLQHPLPPDEKSERPLIFISTLGTTEACAQQLRKRLENEGKEVVIFHTVGSGGKSMEEMIDDENVSAVVDLSLHEIADHLFGGDYDAGPDRGSAALQKGSPCVLVPGNIDFLVTGPLKTAQTKFPDRKYHVHNAAITVVRTGLEEMTALAKSIAKLCNNAKGPLKILVPMKGFSAFDSQAGPLYDPDAPGLFAKTLKDSLDDHFKLNMLPLHINDFEFARAIIETLDELGMK
ncbi:MAG: Tm-1-like ATP-binding domain-containing protein [Deltaproteobacteria bacterium]|nr:MAG: Tm-1-like ATP-binding domain-containing protein [Deltaproteobacteria bacterium]